MKQENEEYEVEKEPIETYYFDEDLAEMVFIRYGEFARIACHVDGIVYGFLVAYINRKKNKFTIRYTNQYDPWGIHHLNRN